MYKNINLLIYKHICILKSIIEFSENLIKSIFSTEHALIHKYIKNARKPNVNKRSHDSINF